MDYKNELKKTILPFWLTHALDTENGGIFTQLDKKGDLYGREKSVWFQGRALWVFSKAYNLIEKNDAYLAAAKNIFAFLPRCTDTDGRMFFTVTADGKGLQKRRYYFSETFAAIGCAEYYKATGDKQALLMAKQYFDVAYACFTGARKTEPKIDPEYFPAKALSPVMILLSTAQTMRTLPGTDTAPYRRIAAADAERRRVERDIRARLKNHGDHAERHAALGDMDARRGRPGLPAAHRVVEARQSPHRLCHAGEAGVGQTQTVKHRRGHAVFRRRGEVERICGEDVAACRLHTVGEIEEHRTARLVRRGIQRGRRRLRAFFKFENVVVDFHGLCPLVGLMGRLY